MWSKRAANLALSLMAMSTLLGAARGGCGGNQPGVPGIDVGGPVGADWAVTYGDTIQVIVKKAGVVVAKNDLSRARGGVFTVDGVQVNITDVCKRSDIACPSEVFPGTVRMTQPGSELHSLRVSFAKAGPLGQLTDTTLLGNVDSDMAFRIELGIKSAALGTCGLLGYSYADGLIREQPSSDPPLGVAIEDGWITTSYAGGCILSGHGSTAGAGLEVDIKIPFTAQRLPGS